MATQAEIKLHYKMAVRQAKTLLQVSADLKKEANQRLEEALSRIAGIWGGEAAKAYAAKGISLQGKLLNAAEDLEEAANALSAAAKRIYTAEMKAYQLAQIRKYGK